MADLDLKKKLLSKCYEVQNEIVENVTFAMNEAQKSANEYGQPKDRYDSYRTQLLGKRDLFAKQLEKALRQLELLTKIDPGRVNEVVSFGTVVVTDDQILFVSVGLGKMEIDNKIFYAISPLVPFYDAMRGKKKGDEFVFRDRTIRILEVY